MKKKIVLAVLSLVVVSMFLAGCAKEEALAGEATRLSLVKTPVLVTFDTIQRHYGNYDFQTTKSAAEICMDLRYSGCFAGQIAVTTKHYESTGGSCENLQLESSTIRLYSCDTDVAGFDYPDCMTIDSEIRDENPQEPYFGDEDREGKLVDVICFK